MQQRHRSLAAAGLLTVLATACGQAGNPPSAAAPGTTGSATASTTITTTAVPAPVGTPAPANQPNRPVGGFAYLPLYPFTDATGVRTWQDAYRSGGHQPWHLDAGATALSFVQGFLGLTGISRVVGVPTRAGDETWVATGFALPDGRDHTAAVVHLARWGSGPDAPWEVAGTRDTTLTLDTPRYGSAATSPLTVGGTVTGVDENLRVRVLGPAGPVGEACCLPAGGDHRRWTTTVPLTAGTPTTGARGALTVVVTTGGHVAEIERFAVTGVTAPLRSP